MPAITDWSPAPTRAELTALRRKLTNEIPAKGVQNEITAVNGRWLPTPRWRDTWVLTKRTGDSFTFETNFLDFTGRFVQHCHVLPTRTWG